MVKLGEFTWTTSTVSTSITVSSSSSGQGKSRRSNDDDDDGRPAVRTRGCKITFYGTTYDLIFSSWFIRDSAAAAACFRKRDLDFLSFSIANDREFNQLSLVAPWIAQLSQRINTGLCIRSSEMDHLTSLRCSTGTLHVLFITSLNFCWNSLHEPKSYLGKRKKTPSRPLPYCFRAFDLLHEPCCLQIMQRVPTYFNTSQNTNPHLDRTIPAEGAYVTVLSTRAPKSPTVVKLSHFFRRHSFPARASFINLLGQKLEKKTHTEQHLTNTHTKKKTKL